MYRSVHNLVAIVIEKDNFIFKMISDPYELRVYNLKEGLLFTAQYRLRTIQSIYYD